MLRLQYFMSRKCRLLYRGWRTIVQWILDHHPFGERFLVYLVGRIGEIRAPLETVKGSGGASLA